MSQRLRINSLGDLVGEDSGNEDEHDEDTEDEDLDDQDSDEEDEDDEDEDDDVDSLKEKLAKAEADRDRNFRRMRRADRAKSKADNELKALREGGQKELAEAQDKIKELEAKLDAAAGTDEKSVIREAFRDFTDVQWNNPKVAFDLLDLSEIDVEDGKVDSASLKEAVDKLKTDHPYLVKTAKRGKNEDEDTDDKNGRQRQRSGSQVTGGRKTAANKRRTAIAAKYGIAPGSRI